MKIDGHLSFGDLRHPFILRGISTEVRYSAALFYCWGRHQLEVKNRKRRKLPHSKKPPLSLFARSVPS